MVRKKNQIKTAGESEKKENVKRDRFVGTRKRESGGNSGKGGQVREPGK